MNLDPTVVEQELLAGTFEREHRGLDDRERLAEAVVAAVFVIATVGLFIARPPHAFDLLAALACVGVLAAATRVQFHVPSGFTVPIQVAFVPLLFVVPAALAPVAVAVSLLLARLPDVIRGRAPFERLLGSIGDSWFAVGPASIFVVMGTDAPHATAGVLLLALVAQFAVDFSVSSARSLLEEDTTFRGQLRESWVYAVDAGLAPIGLVVAHQVEHGAAAILAVLPLLAILRLFARERRARLESLLELKDAYHGTALVLGDVVEADDGYTGEHCQSVVELALRVGQRLGLDAQRLRNLEFGALLHDVGKVAIAKDIINKPGKLSAREFTIVKTHTVEGQRMLDRVGGFMREVGMIVRSHHERWDGGGYPDGLAGEEIPLESRIVSCCDSWNAMRTHRPYRPALPFEDAVAEIVSGTRSQFDPRVADALLAIVQDEAPAAPATFSPAQPERQSLGAAS